MSIPAVIALVVVGLFLFFFLLPTWILSGKLYEHLAETDQVCRDRMERMIAQMAEAEGINEKLKASDQLGWISQMNSIRSQAEEIVLQEIIYS